MDFLISDGYSKRTSECSERERFDYWRDAVCDEFVRLDCEKVESGRFTGELRGGVGVSSLRFSEVIADPQFVQRSKKQIANSTEEDFLISFQLASQGIIRQNGREALLTPGSFALYDTTQPYSLTFNERFHQLVVQMPKQVLSNHLMNPERYTAVPISSTAGLGRVLSNFIFSLIQEMHEIHRAPGELSENLVNMMAMAFSSSVMLKQVGSHTTLRDSLKRRIRQYIDANLSNPELSNQCIAESLGISVRYLHKLFQDEVETIHALIVHKRLERGYRLLSDPSYAGHSVESVAYSVGFSSPAHFSRSFKKKYSVSPSDIR